MLSQLVSLLSGEGDVTSILMSVFSLAILIIICFPVHESAHAWMASKLGDRTGRLSGRISLNPMAHLSLWGTLCMVLVGVGYAKPVPVNIRNFPAKKRKLYFALTALAGPLSNLIMAVIAILFLNIFSILYMNRPDLSFTHITVSFFYMVALYNIVLMLFNMLPIPPLDGSRIWTMLLPDDLYYKFLSIEKYLVYGLLAVLLIFNRISSFSPLSWLSGYVFDGLNAVISLPFRLIVSGYSDFFGYIFG